MTQNPPEPITSAAARAISSAGAGMRALFFVIFAISGFAGLIYESIWTHYLKLFLGHAAFAQTLVLAIFMLGMAAGSWLAGRYSARWRNLLLAYAVVEGLIGVMGVAFHGVYTRVTELAYHSVLPNVNALALAETVKWGVATALIAPQSVLLGMTFPLMSAGLIRRFPQTPGASLVMLYFTNSLGAAVGVLVSGFVLIERVGLPGTILTAGIINVLLAAIVWLLVRAGSGRELLPPPPTRSALGGARLLLAVALLTGTASFIYEIGWLRMLALVLGSSTHAFELMLSAFIFGLAFGGLWIRRRIDRLGEPMRFLGGVQLLMGVLALATLPVYGRSFEFMQWALGVLSKTEAAYPVFNLVSHLLALAVMLPATFLAGMTLPLITYALLRRGHGERSIGSVYAANTLGAIVGVLVAVHIAMPVLGLKGLIIAGASIDVALGLVLLWPRVRAMWRMAAGAAALATVALTALWVELDAHKMASGVYRFGRLLSPATSEIRYHKDGKTTTVDLVAYKNGVLALHVNGKADATIAMTPDSPATGDEPTMVMLGVIGAAVHPRPRTAAVIGFGAGLTTEVLLRAPWLERVDTIEIEPAVLQAAQAFRPRVEAAFTDPRGRVYIADAKAYFATRKHRYDIIVSEPSNPWVSGVASLFSQEFYARVRRHLTEDGVFVQWLQLYEFSPTLLASVLKALSPHFADYVIYSGVDADLVIVATQAGPVPEVDLERLAVPALATALGRVGLRSRADFESRRLGNKRTLDPLFASFPVPANSDYFPFLDLRAAKARYLQSQAGELVGLKRAALPALEMLSGASNAPPPLSAENDAGAAKAARGALALREFLEGGATAARPAQLPDGLRQDARLLLLLRQGCRYAAAGEEWLDALRRVAGALFPYLSAAELQRLWPLLVPPGCAARLNAGELRWLALLRAVAARDAEAMALRSKELLAGTPTWDAGRLDYVLAAGMLGHLARGERAQALALWQGYATQVAGERQPNVLYRLLVAHSQQ